MKSTIKLAGQPSGAVELAISYNADTDACVLLTVTNDDGATLDVLLSGLQVQKLADMASDAAAEAAGV